MAGNKKTSKGTSGNPNNPIPGSIPFTAENQPDPQAKKDGWARKRGAEAIKAAFLKYSAMSLDDLLLLQEKVKKKDFTGLDGEKLTPADMHAILHATNEKYTIDYMNRGVSYAKAEQKITIEDEHDLSQLTDEELKTFYALSSKAKNSS